MAAPRTNSAWLLVRKATGMTDATIIEATGITAATLQDMRRRCREMDDMGQSPLGNWTLDRERHGAIFETNRDPA